MERVNRTEAIRDIAAILERVERGSAVVIERDERPVAILRPAPRGGRLLSDCVALAESHGSDATLDEGFGKDLDEVIRSRPEALDDPRWD